MKQTSALPPDVLGEIARAIDSITYGSVQIIIHDSRVVEIEKAEKIRLKGADLTTGGACEERSLADRTTGGFQPLPGR